jgi:hypothetical protein
MLDDDIDFIPYDCPMTTGEPCTFKDTLACLFPTGGPHIHIHRLKLVDEDAFTLIALQVIKRH